MLLDSLVWSSQLKNDPKPRVQSAIEVADQQFKTWIHEVDPEILSILCAAVTGSTSLIEGSKIILTLQQMKGGLPGSNTYVKTLFLPWDDAMDQEAFNKKMHQFLELSKAEMGL